MGFLSGSQRADYSNNTGVGCHFLLQGIYPAQGSNWCLLHWQVDSLPPCIPALSHRRTSTHGEPGVSGDFWGSQEGCQGPFRTSGWNVGLLLRCCSGHTWLLCPWGSPGKNTGVGCHSLLQAIFLTQGSNPGPLRLLLCTQGVRPRVEGKQRLSGKESAQGCVPQPLLGRPA